MGNTDSLPVVSQAKSLVQWIGGDSEGARETQWNFVRGCPVVSQSYAAVLAIDGDMDGARESQEYFGRNMSALADGVPVIGHIKGGIHYALGDTEGGDNAMKAASRSVGVVAGGLGGMVVGGPVGAIAGGISGGAAMDGIITGAESAVKGQYTPYGHVRMATDLVQGNLTVGNAFDWVMMPVFDGVAGRAYGKAYNSIRARIQQHKQNKSFRQVVKEAVEQGDITLKEGATIKSLANELKMAAKELKATYEQAQSKLSPGQKAISSVVIDMEGNQHIGYNFKFREAIGVDAFEGQVPSAAQIIEQRLPGRAIPIRGMKAGQAQCAEIHALHKHHTANGLTSNPARTITIIYDGQTCQGYARCGSCTKVSSYVKMGEVITDGRLAHQIIPIDNAAIKASIDLLAPACSCHDVNYKKK